MTRTSLADVFASQRSGYWGSDPGTVEVDCRVIRNGDVLNTSEIRWDSLPTRGLRRTEMEKAHVTCDDIILTTSGDCGFVAHVSAEPSTATCASNFVRILRVDPSKAHGRYVFHFMKRPRFRASLRPFIRGTTLKNLAVADALKESLIPLPSLVEQERIAALLDKAEAIQAKRQRALDGLGVLARAMFFELFGDPIANPKKWQLVRFAEVCERVTVGVVVKPASYYVADGVPALRSLNVKPGRIVLDNVVYFSRADSESKLAKSQLKPGDLVLVRSGRPGTAAIVPADLAGANCIDLLIVTPRTEAVDATFLCDFFNSPGGRDLVLSRQRGQVQKHLNVGALKEAMIPLPPVDLQREFARRVDAIEKVGEDQRSALAQGSALVASLQDDAFREAASP